MENYNDSQTNRVSFDPGWNDPPMMSYNSQQTTPNRPRNFLNKRVAFPLTGNSPSSAQPVINCPPIPAVTPSLLVTQPLNHFNSPVAENIVIDSNCTLKDVKEILTEFLDASSELGCKAKDIKRRIAIMEEMWTSGKLNAAVQMQMKDLACALRDDQPSKADEIHRALMVDHVSIVGTWMPGIKHLVHHCIARSELLAIDKDTDDL